MAAAYTIQETLMVIPQYSGITRVCVCSTPLSPFTVAVLDLMGCKLLTPC